MHTPIHIKVGTRGSALALAQTKLVCEAIEHLKSNIKTSIIEIKTTGDRKQGTTAARSGDKKDWILELERAILSGQVDLAVHSGKDVPADIERGTCVSSILKREYPFDVFIGQRDIHGQQLSWRDVPHGGKIGTASLRRQASLLALRPDLNLVEHRGNVTTRLAKLFDDQTLSGIILARSGLARLSIQDLKFDDFNYLQLIPAMNQGTLCIQYLADNQALHNLIKPLVDTYTELCFNAERVCIGLLQADCKSSVGCYAYIKNDKLYLSARVLSNDGQQKVEAIDHYSELTESNKLGVAVAEKLIQAGARELIAQSS